MRILPTPGATAAGGILSRTGGAPRVVEFASITSFEHATRPRVCYSSSRLLDSTVKTPATGISNLSFFGILTNSSSVWVVALPALVQRVAATFQPTASSYRSYVGIKFKLEVISDQQIHTSTTQQAASLSSERGGQKAQVKRKRQINPERKEKAYQRYMKRNKTKTRRNRLANKRYSKLSLTISNQMNNHSEPGLEASGDLEPNSAHDNTLRPSNMLAPIDYTPVGVFTPDQPVIEQPTGAPLP
ncbi:hypothetical protein PCANC_26999 [Puccinia coronata f. sp. avenae]|uniref:Uncharacterized protein n=1 Tax=Puccinia coronata f. sp. avenae TaxID=200324 RepID=A0A2N5S6X5_9BASI|nr:hypothetical protein PCANC_26999 [Puccinia coronata f. sp. avenae]